MQQMGTSRLLPVYKSWAYHDPTFTSTAKSNIHGSEVTACIWWHQLGIVYYVHVMLKPTEVITDYC